MKAKRRHDLRQNVLGSELTNIVDFLKKRGTILAWGVLIVAVIILVFVWIHARRQTALNNLQTRYDRLAMGGTPVQANLQSVVDEYKALAGQKNDLRIAALSTVDLGDLFARRALMATAAVSLSQQKEFADQAEKYYRQAVRNFPHQKLAVAKAHIGLGLLAEGQRDLTTARKEYQAVIDMGDVAGGVLADLAHRHLNSLAKVEAPVKMATTAPATQPAETQPASQPAKTQPAAKTKPAAKPAPAPAAKTKPAAAHPKTNPPASPPKAVAKPKVHPKPAAKPAPVPAAKTNPPVTQPKAKPASAKPAPATQAGGK